MLVEDHHVARVFDQVGGIDVSFNLIPRGDVQGTRLVGLDVDDFLRPSVNGLRSNFLTARAGARRMVRRGSGVILMLTSGSGPAWTAPGVWPMGGTGPADAATESFMRYLASEVGPRGVRVNCLWTAGVTSDPAELVADPQLQRMEAAKDALVGMSMLRKRPSVQEVADTAAFLASDPRERHHRVDRQRDERNHGILSLGQGGGHGTPDL